LILSYHRIGDGSSSDLYRPLWGATPEQLDDQLRLIKRRFEVLDPARLSRDLLTERGRRVMVTFDDGYRDLYELAHPVLESNRVRAAMFLCSGFIDGNASAWWDEIAWMLHHSKVAVLAPGPWYPAPLSLSEAELELAVETVIRAYWKLDESATQDLLDRLADSTGAGRRPTASSDWITWKMARELRDAGHVIGAHTLSHPLLSRVPPTRQREEIVGSLDRIEQELGERPRWLAYPVGTRDAVTETTRHIADLSGVELAFNNARGRVVPGKLDRLDIYRVPAETLRAPSVFSATLALPQVFLRPDDGSQRAA
jgi:peptidoglycan/xylan/chitin deacetylase (PgdA/CDA1 family)